MTSVEARLRHPVEPDSRTDEQRLGAAMQSFVRDFGRTTSLHLDACVHCGQCAEACHYYIQTEDPKYTPILKLEPFRKAYRATTGPFSFLRRLVGTAPKVTLEKLADWQELIYGSCNGCGRCTIICPMGIDIATMIGQARHGLYAAGLAPAALADKATLQEAEGSPLGLTPEKLREYVATISKEHDIEIPLDAEQAEVLVTISSIEWDAYPEDLFDTARLMNHTGLSWTIRTDGYECTNFGLVAGNPSWQKEMTRRLIDAAIKCGAKTVVIPECGHAYGALRWMGASAFGKPLPFRVLHLTEFMAENIKAGRIKVKPITGSVAFHDPCQVGRRGGVFEAPRAIIKALGLELREMRDNRVTSFCCGGGGGVLALKESADLRLKAFEIKMQEVEETGADEFYTSCANCRKTFDKGQAHFQWDKQAHSLLDLVVKNLAP